MNVLIIGFTGLVIAAGACAVGWWAASKGASLEESLRKYAFDGWTKCLDDLSALGFKYAACQNELRACEAAKFELETQLQIATKKLIDLEGQTPGRDKSGRFVKRDKVSLQKI